MKCYKNFIFSIILISCNVLAQSDPTDYVNVFTGTSNSRWMLFPGPTMPFGMVKLSPDNQTNVWNGGYEYTIGSIAGFSHIHSWAMGGLSLMPTTGEVKTFPGSADGPFKHMWTAGYRSRFNKTTEVGEPGYYKVRLYDYNITTELTSTTRCGYLRFTYPKSDKSNILINFATEYEENNAQIKCAYYKKVSSNEIEGYIKQYSSFADEYTVHFIMKFSKPFKEIKSWEQEPFSGNDLFGTDWQIKNNFYSDNEKELSGKCGVALIFDTGENEVIEVKSAISLVSIDQARLNYKTEIEPFGWDFKSVVDNNKAAWNELLGKIKVEDSNKELEKQFYTNLYRAFSARTIWSDVNGKYTDMCENIQQAKSPADNVYGCDALWGSHWNLTPLWTLVTPKIANSWVNSLLEIYDKGGWLPQGPTGIEYAEVMVAAHQIKMIISAYQKGIRDFDIEKAYEAIYKNQTVPGHKFECGGWVGNKNLDSFIKYGYVANEDGPVSNTLEIAFDDWAVAQFAKALVKEDDYKYFMERSRDYKNIFDPSVKFMRQKHADGSWVKDWDSLSNHGTWFGAGYVEGTAWHYSYFVPHDYAGLIDLVGEDLFINRLAGGFEKGYIDVGNQPNMQAPFIFNYTKKPWLTQKYVHKLLSESFDTSPLQGWPGEEDQGQLGAWYVLASIGLFQMDGGCSVNPYYDLSSPLFDKVTIKLDEKYYSGNELVITTEKKSRNDIYIQSVSFNGKELNSLKIPHAEIIKGGELKYILGNKPNKNLLNK
ncbi:MAG: GH92 family glycosyl hydrolase [Melioribacteraceae bacterium]|nr:GH92 family glycosyl hydrolase [Melioribacteraceae bacterium]